MVNQNLPKFKDKTFLLLLTLNTSLGAFYNGFSLTYFNAIQYSQIQQIYHLQSYPQALTQGLLTGSSAITAALGSTLTYFYFKNTSRLQCLKFISLTGFISSFLCLLPNALILIVARLIQGLLIGAISVINPIYIRQLMPKSISGKMWTIHQLSFTLGLAGSFILVFIYSRIIGLKQQQYWRLIFGFSIVTCGIQFYIFRSLFPYQTPKYLISANRYQQAKSLLSLIYLPEYVEGEFNEINANFVEKEQQMKQINQVNKILIDKTNKAQKSQKIKILKTNTFAIIAGINLAFAQQFYGQPAIVQYGVQLTNNTFPSLWNTFPVLINISGSIGSIISIFTVQKYGRKELIVKGGSIMAGLLFIIGFCFSFIDALNPEKSSFLIRMLICLSVIFLRTLGGITVGPITWLILSEILQPHIVSLCGALNWISLALVNIAYPILVSQSHQNNPAFAYFFFCIVSLISIFINRLTVIQTKSKSQREIIKQYEDNWPSK